MKYMEFILILVIGVFIALYLDLRSRVGGIEATLRGKGMVTPTSVQEPIFQDKPAEPKQEVVAAMEVKEAPVKEVAKPKSPDFEIKWGAKTFTAIGGVALLFGVGFFLRYAFEKNLITPTMRVVIGLAVGCVCLGLGEWLRKKYASYGQALIGLGLGVFYLSLYAALHLYHIMSSPQAFIAMIAVTVAGLVLGVRLDSEPLAAFALVGGLLTPMLVSSGENRPLVLFPYLTLLDAAILVFSLIKTWRRINLVGIAGTAIVFLFWYQRFFTEAQWVTAQVAVSAFFIIFVIAGLSRYIVHKENQGSHDLAVTSLNPFLYAIATYAIVPEVYREWVGTYFALLGVLYIAAMLLIKGRDARDIRYKNFFAIIGSAFLASAAPIAFDGNAVIIAWAVVSCALTYWSYVMDSKPLRAAGAVIGLLASFSTLGMVNGTIGVTPWLNERFLTVAFLAFTQAAMVAVHRAKGVKEEMMNEWISLDAIKTYALVCFLFGSEIFKFYDHVWAILVLSILALAGGLVSLALRNIALRGVVYATYALSVMLLVTEYLKIDTFATPFLNLRFLIGLGLILSAWILSIILRRAPVDVVKQDERELIRPIFFIGIHFMGLWLLSSEIITWFNLQLMSASNQALAGLRAAKNASLSIAWMIYAIALLVYGFAIKYKIARQFAAILFGIVILKAFLYDTAELSNFYRFISFMTLGVLLLISGYLYTRFKNRSERKA
jgi:uncharacterized membrane protein